MRYAIAALLMLTSPALSADMTTPDPVTKSPGKGFYLLDQNPRPARIVCGGGFVSICDRWERCDARGCIIRETCTCMPI